MERRPNRFKRLPERIRKPIVLVSGMTLVLASGLFGWIPGPGGIPLFLAGVAILATEYDWAERFKQRILLLVNISSQWYAKHRVLGSTFITVGVTIGALTMVMLFL